MYRHASGACLPRSNTQPQNFPPMAHFAAIPALEYVAAEVAPTLFTAAAAGTLAGAVKRTRREGLFHGESFMKRAVITPSPGPPAKKMKYTPKRLFGTKAGTSTRTSASRYRSQLGRYPGKFSTRRHTSFPALNSQITACEMHGFRLINCPWSDNDVLINRRQSNLVNVRGVRLRVQFALNNSLAESEAGTQLPIEVRWAIINPKQNTGAAFDRTVFNDEFLISRNPGEQMALDFPTGANKNYWTLMYDAINKEKYGVVKEGRFMLTPNFYANNGFSNVNSANKLMQIYIPIKRQMKWENNNEDAGSEYPEANLYFVYWYTSSNNITSTNPFDGTTGKTPPLAMRHEMTLYFKNSRMYS